MVRPEVFLGKCNGIDDGRVTLKKYSVYCCFAIRTGLMEQVRRKQTSVKEDMCLIEKKLLISKNVGLSNKCLLTFYECPNKPASLVRGKPQVTR
jgi:hypothetical protein